MNDGSTPNPAGSFGGPGGPAFEQRGVIPLRPLTLNDIFAGAWATMRRNPGSTIGFSAVVGLIVGVAGLPLALRIQPDAERMLRAQEARALTPEDFAWLTNPSTLGWLGVSLVAAVLGWIAVTAYLTAVVGRAAIGRPASLRDIWPDFRSSAARLPALALGFAVLVLVPALLTAFITGMILPPLAAVTAPVVLAWLAVRFSLSTPALVLEQSGVVHALRRSAELVRGAWWRIFGMLLLTLLIAFAVDAVVSMIISPLSVGGGTASILGGLFGSVVVTALTQPFVSGVTALLYVDQRIRREGLAEELARA